MFQVSSSDNRLAPAVTAYDRALPLPQCAPGAIEPNPPPVVALVPNAEPTGADIPALDTTHSAAMACVRLRSSLKSASTLLFASPNSICVFSL